MLPNRWARTTLDQITRISSKRAHPRTAGDLPYIGLEHIEAQTMRLLGRARTADMRSAATVFHKDDVLYGRMRPYLNKVWKAEFDGLCSTEFIVFEHLDRIDPGFLALRLNANDFVAFANGAARGERPRVNSSEISRFHISLPPFSQQKRITQHLHAIRQKMDRAAISSKNALQRLARYKTALLDAAVSGDLTEEWRSTATEIGDANSLLLQILEQRRSAWLKTNAARTQSGTRKGYREPATPQVTHALELPSSWTWASVEQLSELVDYGTSVKTTADNEGVPVLRMGNIVDGKIVPTNLKFLPNTHPDLLLQDGDVLFNRTNSRELVGKTAVYRGTPSPCSFASYLIRVRAMAGIVPELIAYFVNSSFGHVWIDSVATQQVGQANVNGTKLQALAIPLPPAPEQKEIVRLIELRLKSADQLKLTIEGQSRQAATTWQTMLDDAFSGRLTDAESGDDDASELLEQLRVSRERAKSLKSTNRKANMTSTKKPVQRLATLQQIISSKFGNEAFTFEQLQTHTSHIDYEKLKSELFSLLRPVEAAPQLRLDFRFDDVTQTLVFQVKTQ